MACKFYSNGDTVTTKATKAIKAGDLIHFKEADNAVSNTEGDGVKVGVALQDAEAKDASVVVKMQ